MVARARRALGERRVGHAGTLDPFATGLVIVLVGGATRLARYFIELPKTYEVVARLGARSAPATRRGRSSRRASFPRSSTLPLGRVRQRPPAYSAVKIDGERAYARARRGEEVGGGRARGHRPRVRAALAGRDRVGTALRLLVGDLRALARRRTRRRLLPRAAAPGDRAVRGGGRLAGGGSGAALGVAEAWARFGDVVALEAPDARAIAHGRAIAARGLEGPVLLVDGAGERAGGRRASATARCGSRSASRRRRD